jgi:hypothetical protein
MVENTMALVNSFLIHLLLNLQKICYTIFLWENDSIISDFLVATKSEIYKFYQQFLKLFDLLKNIINI